MADMLASPQDIGKILELGDDLDVNKATVLMEAATAVVQEAADTPPQRIVLVEDDEQVLLGDLASWLALPQRPVQSVASVKLDGFELAEGVDFSRFGSRLYRQQGWLRHRYRPSTVEVLYTHGYPEGHQGLQLARSAVISLIRGVYGNPEGAIAVRIDDYSASYGKFSAAMEATEYLATALNRQYGRRFAVNRTGG